ncbi:MAG: AMP-binding protein [Candidatus Azotimanducaceae bacterium]|uniref:Malonyl-CoA synthase n=1 Tax=OM182 bacterium TaxID=2510334 RepID=A0A520S3R1_9GAMM|nr:MAG: malonyl-CoA synthase [OM182 bacterium]
MSNAYNFFFSGVKEGSAFIRNPQGQILYTYEDFAAITGMYANFLLETGLKPGDRVMVQVAKSPECLMFYFACMQAGCIYVPLNTSYKTDELAYFIEDAKPSMILCEPKQRNQFHELSDAHIFSMDSNGIIDADLPSLDSQFEPLDRSDDDVAVIIYTSGTTGRPKGAMITHANIKSNVATLSDYWEWRTEDILLHALPIFHIHGLFVASHLPVLNGSPIIFLDHFDAKQIAPLLYESTVYMGVPTNYTRLLAQPELTKQSCSNMRIFISGSAPLLVSTFEEFKLRTGHTIVERYGMSETGMNISNPIHRKRKAGTVGFPLPGIECRIVDDNDQKVGINSTGNLEIRGPNIFKGYWNMPDRTASEFSAEGFFRTGDLAQEDAEGYISIVGRSKDMIISGGLNIYPKEIEDVLDFMDGIEESAIIGLPDPDYGEAVSAIIVKDSSSRITSEQVKVFIKENLASFKTAKHVFFVDELPRNTMGKVQKNTLRKIFSDKLKYSI